jgi:hypothetical protein
LRAARDSDDRDSISRLAEKLNEITTPFAERIMDRAIKQALEKKTLEEFS